MTTSFKSMSKYILGASAVALLAGCAAGDNGMRGEIQGTALHKYLNVGYAQLAAAEGAEADHDDQAYFAAKAKAAAMGEDVRETQLDERAFLGDTGALAYRARVLVVSMRRKGAFEKFPGPAAKLQVAHDCYLQELEENRQAEDIAACKAELDAQYARLEELMKEPPAPVAEKEVALPDVPGPFNIYFGFDSAVISESAMNAIKAIAQSAMKAQVTRVKIYGNTDKAGDTAYNARLGLERARAVKAALTDAGLTNVPMTVQSKGETAPQVDTTDGKKERLNRRVELTLVR